MTTEARRDAGTWMGSRLATQGYCLTADESRHLAVALRFSTGVCLTLVVLALALQSAVMVLALSGIGVVASFAARHPFDHVWNQAARQLVGGPVLPPNPRRRRDAFKVATAWLALVGILLAAGATTAALVLGAMLVAACATVTATNLCLPSETFAWLERRRAARETITS
jgi:hypothetical protein